MTITFQVPGVCKAAGSKRGIAIYGGSGAARHFTGRVAVVDDCEKSKDWKADVRSIAQDTHHGPLLDVPLSVSFEFIVARPVGHYGSGKNSDKLKASSPQHPTIRPDLLKLARGVEDAMTGVIYTDDSLIVQEVLTKRYAASRTAFIGVCVTIQTLEEVVVSGAQVELIPNGESALL